jgi:hypothetical protein
MFGSNANADHAKDFLADLKSRGLGTAFVDDAGNVAP